jgi:hypothetical protein
VPDPQGQAPFGWATVPSGDCRRCRLEAETGPEAELPFVEPLAPCTGSSSSAFVENSDFTWARSVCKTSVAAPETVTVSETPHTSSGMSTRAILCGVPVMSLIL